MKKTRKLLESAVRDLEASPKTSPTSAGQTEQPSPPDTSRIETINQVFALFRLNYHNQYYSAFPDESQLKQIKKLWLESLSGESAETILRAARHCIEQSEYLPTLHRFIEACREDRRAVAGIPDARSAYREACLAGEPKAAQTWSHTAVYQAGVEVGWFFLATTPESRAYPVFANTYQRICEDVAAGKQLPAINKPAAPLPAPAKADLATRKLQLRRFRKETGL